MGVLTRVQTPKRGWTPPKPRPRLDVQTPATNAPTVRRQDLLNAWIAPTTWQTPQASLGCLELPSQKVQDKRTVMTTSAGRDENGVKWSMGALGVDVAART